MAAKDLEDGLPEQAKPLDVLQEPRTSKESIPLSSCPTQARIFADIVATDPAAAAEQSPSRVEGLDRRATHESEASYSIFTHSQKIFIVLAVSFMAIISPLSGSAYLPALPEIAADLNVSNSLINLTVTTYLIFQGIAPSFVGNFSDVYGRRPAYVICSVIYLAANIGLALQRNYAALLVLRMLQSCGSSATVALGSATVADLVTRAERGKFIGYAGMGITLGPAIGPVAGGLLSQYQGWPSIFWFLTIVSAVLFLLIFTFLPETCRAVVGNGSVPSRKWNRTLWDYFQELRRGKPKETHIDRDTISGPRRRPNPFLALKILAEKEGGVTLGYGSLLYGGYYAILVTLSSNLSERFGFSQVTIGLCYLPIGVGSFLSRWTCGYLLDWNFRRHAKRLNIELSHKRQQNIDILPIEMIRLQISIPFIYISCCTIIGYGWALEKKSSLAGIEISLFFCGLFFSGALNGLNTLIVDTHANQPATAVAANNLFRCLVGAGAAALALPLIHKIGMGWMGMLVAGIWVAFSPCLWLVLFHGAKWRQDLKVKREKRDAEQQQVVNST